MRTIGKIVKSLPLLDAQVADDLEDQDLDFKQWDLSSKEKAINLVVKMAICFANGGGGTVVFGVADKVVGRSQAVLGVPKEVDINLLK
jgi:ATP-dependent DNA helicase RecG